MAHCMQNIDVAYSYTYLEVDMVCMTVHSITVL